MDIKKFKERCEKVVLVEELQPVSRLRQKVEGCYTAFGMCPEGETVALDMKGNVNCLKAELYNSSHLCEDNGLSCRLEAEPSNILGVIDLLHNFLLKNFTTKEGLLPQQNRLRIEKPADSPETEKEGPLPEAEYLDEDLGISNYLSEDEKTKRRQQDADKGKRGK